MLNDKCDKGNDIGKRVTELKDKRSEDAKALAALINVSPSYMSRLLRDNASWSLSYVETMAKHYNVSEDYLIYGRTSRDRKSEKYEVQFMDVMLTVHKQPLADQLNHAMVMIETTAKILRNLQDELPLNEKRPSK